MALGMRRLRLARSRYTDFWRDKADKSDGISTQSRYTLPCVPDTPPQVGRRPVEHPAFAAGGRIGGVGGRPPTANKGWECCHRQPNTDKWSPSPGGRARGTTRSGPGGVGRFRSTIKLIRKAACMPQMERSTGKGITTYM